MKKALAVPIGVVVGSAALGAASCGGALVLAGGAAVVGVGLPIVVVGVPLYMTRRYFHIRNKRQRTSNKGAAVVSKPQTQEVMVNHLAVETDGENLQRNDNRYSTSSFEETEIRKSYCRRDPLYYHPQKLYDDI